MQAKASAPLDLTRDNRIRRLLEERERQAAIIRKAKLIKDEAEAEIREKLGEAEEAFTDEWQITIRTVHRREFTGWRSGVGGN
jgi:predicted phage-related endonuclease